MALSRIWSAFILVAFLVAGIKMVGGDEKIFNRMVVGKSSDKYDSVFYFAIGSPVNQKLGKSTSWEEGQRTYSAFNYENKNLHEKAQRLFPGAHPVHDNPEEHEQNPS